MKRILNRNVSLECGLLRAFNNFVFNYTFECIHCLLHFALSRGKTCGSRIAFMRMYTQVYRNNRHSPSRSRPAEKVTTRDGDEKRQVEEFESHLGDLPCQREKESRNAMAKRRPTRNVMSHASSGSPYRVARVTRGHGT